MSTEHNVFKSPSSPIDWEKGLYSCGDENILIMMLEKIEDMTLNPESEVLFNNVMAMDYKKIYQTAHKLWGPFSYIAATKLMGLLKQLEKAAESHDDKTIVELYLAIVDASKVFKTHIATFFNQQHNLSDFDRYEEKVKQKYANFFPSINMEKADQNQKPAASCSGCGIF